MTYSFPSNRPPSLAQSPAFASLDKHGFCAAVVEKGISYKEETIPLELIYHGYRNEKNFQIDKNMGLWIYLNIESSNTNFVFS